MRVPISKLKWNALDMSLWSPLERFPTKSNMSQVCGYGNHREAWEWVEVENSPFPLCLLCNLWRLHHEAAPSLPGLILVTNSHMAGRMPNAFGMTLRVKWQSHLRSSFTVLPGSPIP